MRVVAAHFYINKQATTSMIRSNVNIINGNQTRRIKPLLKIKPLEKIIRYISIVQTKSKRIIQKSDAVKLDFSWQSYAIAFGHKLLVAATFLLCVCSSEIGQLSLRVAIQSQLAPYCIAIRIYLLYDVFAVQLLKRTYYRWVVGCFWYVATTVWSLVDLLRLSFGVFTLSLLLYFQ